jgi:putative endopeptidase
LIRTLLEEAANRPDPDPKSPRRQVGDFFASAMDTNRVEQLALRPIPPDLDRLEAMEGPDDAARLLADWHQRGISAVLPSGWVPDAKKSDTYALHLGQGGLRLPDRDYYLAEGFAKQRTEYRRHLASMLQMLGEGASDADYMAGKMIELETELAKSSRTRTDLRDQEKNYNKMTRAELAKRVPPVAWDATSRPPASEVRDVVIGQPEFFEALGRLATGDRTRDLADAYLRWHLIRSTAPLLHGQGRRRVLPILRHHPASGPAPTGTPLATPPHRRPSADAGLGEALGQLYVETHFPAEARTRMAELVREREGGLQATGSPSSTG